MPLQAKVWTKSITPEKKKPVASKNKKSCPARRSMTAAKPCRW